MNPQPPAYPVAGNQPPNEGLAVASLVCGIGSVTCFGILSGVPAIICGHLARGKIARAGGTLGGAGMALAGLIMGYVSLAYTVLVFLIIIPAVAIPVIVAARQGAENTQALTQIKQLDVALDAYALEYGKPVPVMVGESGTADNAAVMAILRGEDEGRNPHQTVFVQWPAKDMAGRQAVDPWKRPLNFGRSKSPGAEEDVEPGSGVERVWSSGPNGINEHGRGDDVVPNP